MPSSRTTRALVPQRVRGRAARPARPGRRTPSSAAGSWPGCCSVTGQWDEALRVLGEGPEARPADPARAAAGAAPADPARPAGRLPTSPVCGDLWEEEGLIAIHAAEIADGGAGARGSPPTACWRRTTTSWSRSSATSGTRGSVPASAWLPARSTRVASCADGAVSREDRVAARWRSAERADRRRARRPRPVRRPPATPGDRRARPGRSGWRRAAAAPLARGRGRAAARRAGDGLDGDGTGSSRTSATCTARPRSGWSWPGSCGPAATPASAREVADLARATAHRLGAGPLLDELRVLGTARAPSGTAGPADRRSPPASGRSSSWSPRAAPTARSARRLFISTKTVSVHVSNILGKLGAAGRTEAVAIARRRGLLE